MTELAIFTLFIGIACVVIEMLIPGFGFFGIVGILSLAISFYVTAVYVPMGLIIIAIEIAIILVIILALYHYFTRKKKVPKIVLTDRLTKTDKKKEDLTYLIGTEAITKTSLRPHGNIQVNDETLEVYSDGYIDAGTKVTIVRIDEHNKIYVEPINVTQ